MALFTLIGGPIGGVLRGAGHGGRSRCCWSIAWRGEWFDAETALLATALVAWNPLFITYAKQPMSDVPATMWIVLALLLAMRIVDAGAPLAPDSPPARRCITRPALAGRGRDRCRWPRTAARRRAAGP